MHLLSSLKSCQVIERQLFGKFNKHKLRNVVRDFQQRNSKNRLGMKLAPPIVADAGGSIQNNLFPKLTKSFLFTVGFCGSVFVGASVWNYESTKSKLKDQTLTDWIQNHWNTVEGWEHKQGEFRKELNKYWNTLPEGKKLFWLICALNVVVFICWRQPKFKNVMLQYFCSNPAAKVVCWPMLLSTFSHYAPLHLAMNMYVLYSFSNAICSSLGSEQFLGFYLAGGVISSFTSNVSKVLTRSLGPSVGASGAIMAFLGYFCSKYPDAKLGIIFIPGFSFSADSAIKGIILLDILGVVLKWKLFDHAAHLGGAIFGILYAYFGNQFIWENREVITKKWESLLQIMDKKE